MTPDLAFGCDHTRGKTSVEFDGVRFRTYVRCVECTTILVEVIRDEKVRA